MKRTTIVAICLVFAFIACEAGAQESDAAWIIGGGVLVSALDREDNLVDNTSIGFKAFAQYRFNSWFGLEGAYLNTGDFSSDATSAGDSRLELVYQGFQAQGFVYIPTSIEQFDFFVKGGYFKFDVDSTVDGVNSGNGTDNGWVLGAGASIQITESMFFRSDFDWYDADDAELWTIGLDLEYRF